MTKAAAPDIEEDYSAINHKVYQHHYDKLQRVPLKSMTAKKMLTTTAVPSKITQRKATPEAEEYHHQQGKKLTTGDYVEKSVHQVLPSQTQPNGSRMKTRTKKREYFEMSGACSSYYKEDWNQYDVVMSYEFLNSKRPTKKFRLNDGGVICKPATAGKHAVVVTDKSRAVPVRPSHLTPKVIQVARKKDDDELIDIPKERPFTKVKRTISQSKGKSDKSTSRKAKSPTPER